MNKQQQQQELGLGSSLPQTMACFLCGSGLRRWALGGGGLQVFVYNKNFHNVVEVSKEDYKACNAASPIATYTTGNDSITLKRRGHHFFICGAPGHCGAGQKVDIRISKLHSPSAAAPAKSTATSSPVPGAADAGGSVSGPAPAPGPRPSAAGEGRDLSPEVLLCLSAISAGLIMM
ncbi:hypothetical protein ZIOFF_057928 [Zingiber officinale]|uniref:Phytocyanin domain-containing protein n=1 Tax=Zingiber officinale TaxID=94328 RepID=A0A8J5F478_ZINOF|nr:hypothetical protein ZIOFF_057928 [Zingiber officinale]